MIKITNISNYGDNLIKIKLILKQWNKFGIIMSSMLFTILAVSSVVDFAFFENDTNDVIFFYSMDIAGAVLIIYQLFVVPLITKKKWIYFLKQQLVSGQKSEAQFTFDSVSITFPDFDADKKIIQATMNYIQFKTIIYFKREKVLLLQRSFKPDSIAVLLDKVDDKTINDIFALLPKNKFHQVAK